MYVISKRNSKQNKLTNKPLSGGAFKTNNMKTEQKLPQTLYNRLKDHTDLDAIATKYPTTARVIREHLKKSTFYFEVPFLVVEYFEMYLGVPSNEFKHQFNEYISESSES